MSELVKISRSALGNFEQTCGQLVPETGGIFFSNKEGVITEFVFDTKGKCFGGGYDPDYESLNIILGQKEEQGMIYCGSGHSHPDYCATYPSGCYTDSIGDMASAKLNLNCNPDLDRFIMFICHSTHSAKFEYNAYIIFRDNPEVPLKAEIEIVEDVPAGSMQLDTCRLEGGVDVPLMKQTSILVVGVGGAEHIIEGAVRCAISSVTAIDFDTVSTSNICSQYYYMDEIGKSKVSVLGDRLNRINPYIHYEGIEGNILLMSDAEIEKLVKGKSIILAMTDDFWAQAKINEISVKYKIPAVFAMCYYKAIACEVTFNLPEAHVNHRDAVIERYAEYYKRNHINDVASTGGNIFGTDYFNGAIGIIMLSILHRHLPDSHFGSMFSDMNRNFIQLRMHPSWSNNEGNMFFEAGKSNEGCRFFDSIWRKVVPAEENPEVVLDGTF